MNHAVCISDSYPSFFRSLQALGNSSPQSRAFAIAILSVVAEHRLEWVLSLLPQLQALARQDSWWEVQAELLILAGTILEQVGDWQEDWAIVGSLVEIVLEVFRPTSPVYVRRVGLSVLARFVVFNGAIKEAFVKVCVYVSSLPRPFLTLLPRPALTDHCPPNPSHKRRSYLVFPLTIDRAFLAYPLNLILSSHCLVLKASSV